jgi:hypothetical protein
LKSAMFLSVKIQLLWSELMLCVPASSNLVTQLLPGACLPLAVLRMPLQPDAELTPSLSAAPCLSSSSSSSRSFLLKDCQQLRATAFQQAI